MCTLIHTSMMFLSSINFLDVQVKEYHKLKQKASRKTAGLSQQLMRLEQEKQTSEQSLEQVRMKKAELELRQTQLKEQGCVFCQACISTYINCM